MVTYQMVFIIVDLYKQLTQHRESSSKGKPGKAQNVMCRQERRDYRARTHAQTQIGRNQKGVTFDPPLFIVSSDSIETKLGRSSLGPVSD
jgi:hypothetical protein